MRIREIEPYEHEILGELTVDAYTALDGPAPSPEYDEALRDVASRARGAVVLVAVDDGEILGGVTFVPDTRSAFAEFDAADAAGIRMLAVRADAWGRGVGRALTEACLVRARDLGRRQVILHSTPWMAAAHALYESLGFVRDPGLDWQPEPEVDLLGYRLGLVAR